MPQLYLKKKTVIKLQNINSHSFTYLITLYTKHMLITFNGLTLALYFKYVSCTTTTHNIRAFFFNSTNYGWHGNLWIAQKTAVEKLVTRIPNYHLGN